VHGGPITTVITTWASPVEIKVIFVRRDLRPIATFALRNLAECNELMDARHGG
jgi:hypothetical protein